MSENIVRKIQYSTYSPGFKQRLLQTAAVVTIEKTQEKAITLEDFVLFYALYKEVGNYYRFSIPTFMDMYQDFKRQTERSQLLFATKDRIPLAALWIVGKDAGSFVLTLGSTREGYELEADFLLVFTTLHEGEVSTSRHPEPSYYPRDDSRWEELRRAFSQHESRENHN